LDFNLVATYLPENVTYKNKKFNFNFPDKNSTGIYPIRMIFQAEEKEFAGAFFGASSLSLDQFN